MAVEEQQQQQQQHSMKLFGMKISLNHSEEVSGHNKLMAWSRQQQQQQQQREEIKNQVLKPQPVLCPRCESMNTKFCYFNNYNVNQPRHFCKNCQRYWTAGGTLRNVPIGAGRRKNRAGSGLEQQPQQQQQQQQQRKQQKSASLEASMESRMQAASTTGTTTGSEDEETCSSSSATSSAGRQLWRSEPGQVVLCGMAAPMSSGVLGKHPRVGEVEPRRLWVPKSCRLDNSRSSLLTKLSFAAPGLEGNKVEACISPRGVFRAFHSKSGSSNLTTNHSSTCNSTSSSSNNINNGNNNNSSSVHASG